MLVLEDTLNICKPEAISSYRDTKETGHSPRLKSSLNTPTSQGGKPSLDHRVAWPARTRRNEYLTILICQKSASLSGILRLD